MDALGGARLQLQLQYDLIGEQFSNECYELVSNIGLGLGWLRAVAQGYNYSYNKITLWNNFQNNLKSL